MPDRVGSRNGYGYVEGNPVNYTDPSGQCTRLTCKQVEDEINQRIRKFIERLRELEEDRCGFYEQSQNMPMPFPMPGGCIGTWEGHQKALENLQNGLREYLACYLLNSPRNSGRLFCENESKTTQLAIQALTIPVKKLKPTRHLAWKVTIVDVSPVETFPVQIPSIDNWIIDALRKAVIVTGIGLGAGYLLGGGGPLALPCQE